MRVEFLFKELVQGNRNFITKNFFFLLANNMILIHGNGEFIAYGIYHRNKSLVSRTTRSMTCDTVRIFSLFISLSLLSFSHMLISCFPNKDKFSPRGKGHGHL